MTRDCATAMGVVLPAVEHHADEPRPSLNGEVPTNGALTPAELRAATRLVPRISSNGTHADGAAHKFSPLGNAPHGNDPVATPAPLQMPERRLDVSERED
jgi:hypothetical protein